MKYCKNCSNEIDDRAVICPYCGIQQEYLQISPQSTDNGGFGWGLLGFCIPIAGLILFLVWKDTKPKTSKAAGIGALINVFGIIGFYILIIILGVSLAIFSL